ncbi:MAG: DUF2147 domain-containing protein [Serpentinimonas sp.]|nr:MAG: hypothetical protein JM57_14035 [Comamonadaceae bacterium BICA1-1]MDO8275759.1 DUF2147 domain-containing protein [Serpentinimonas sp.]MDO9610518.1 DUF2147 domain-containing protein [Serpentinimonas sp.]
MKNTLRHTLLAAGLLLAGSAWAQMSPVGTWHSIDDQTSQPRTEVVISDNAGVLTGRITRLLRPGADPAARCTACTDDRKDQPMVGLEIIRGARQAEGRTVWEGGRILDPEDGRTYTLRLTPIEEGRKLQVRGSIGPFGRTQTWVRVQ